MNYKESKAVLNLIKKHKSFVLVCHEGPDQDSIASCMVLKTVLEDMGKVADVYSPEAINAQSSFLDTKSEIKVTDPGRLDFGKYDVFFALDVNTLSRLGLNLLKNFSGMVVNIDHHEDGGFGNINITDVESGSTSAVLYRIIKDWQIDLGKDSLDMLLAGIIADSSGFKFTVNPLVLNTVEKIMEEGGNYYEAYFQVFQNYDLKVLKFWAEAINRTLIDQEGKFAYTIIPADVFREYKSYGARSRQVSDEFLRCITGTDFCVVIVERDNREAKVSVRTRTPGFWVIDLVRKLGGGGHLSGGGALVKAESFEKACEIILRESRAFAKKKRADLRQN